MMQMDKQLFLIFNHRITSIQQDDARRSLAVDQITDLPPDLKAMWRQIPPDLTGIDSYLEPIKRWLKEHSNKGDYVLIQGDFGACFIMVNFALEKRLIPVYSTTEREAMEEHGDDGTIKLTHHFKHHVFRRYGV